MSSNTATNHGRFTVPDQPFSHVAQVALLYSEEKLSLTRYLWLVRLHDCNMTSAANAAHAVWTDAADIAEHSGRVIAERMCPDDVTPRDIDKIHGYPPGSHVVMSSDMAADFQPRPDFNKRLSKATTNELLDIFEWRNLQVTIPRGRKSGNFFADGGLWPPGPRIAPTFFDHTCTSFVGLNLDLLESIVADIQGPCMWCKESLTRAWRMADWYAEVTEPSLLKRFPGLKCCRLWALALEGAIYRAPEGDACNARDPLAILPAGVQEFLRCQADLGPSTKRILRPWLTRRKEITWEAISVLHEDSVNANAGADAEESKKRKWADDDELESGTTGAPASGEIVNFEQAQAKEVKIG